MNDGDPELEDLSIMAWLKAHVTDDPRALRWFEGQAGEARIRNTYRELLAGYAVDPASVLDETRKLDPDEPRGVVTVSSLRFYSICAHHFLPFFGEATVSYLPGERIVGLGRVPRLLDALARRFTIQEDLTRELAETLLKGAEARGVSVVTNAQHLCMCARGPAQFEASTRVAITLGEMPA